MAPLWSCSPPILQARNIVKSAAANPCREGHAGSTRWLNDARGIPCGKVCDRCEDYVRSGFRVEIFTDGDYWTDEPIDAG